MGDRTDIWRVAVVGVAKNTGKTTTLNALLAEAVSGGHRPGVVSVGVDGESIDALVGIDKPAIWLPAGSLVATTHRAAEASEARLEYLEALEFQTPMGEAVIVEVMEPGTVLLAGMRHREDVRRAVERLEAAGASGIFVDGAYDRMAAASGDVVDGVVLSTGAVVAGRVDGIVEQTAPWVERLRLEAPGRRRHVGLVRRAIEEGEVRVLGEGGEEMGSGRSALMGLDGLVERIEQGALGAPVEAVAVPGLISDRVVEALEPLAAAGGTSSVLIGRDPTVFRVAEPEIWRRLTSAWEVRILEATRLLAVGVNPTGVQGERVDRGALMEAFSIRWSDLRVFDPMAGTGRPAVFRRLE